jgi:endo-1,4-beta-xylanase
MIQSRHSTADTMLFWRRQLCFALAGPLVLTCARSSFAATGARAESTWSLAEAGARHHIRIGAAASARYLNEPDYTKILASQFSQLQPENEMKFAVIQPGPRTYNFAPADALVSFAQSHNLAVRGHTLVWHRQVPAWISAGQNSPSQLSDILKDHIASVLSRYQGKVYAWDVVNEAFNDDGSMRSTVWYDQPGIGFREKQTKYIEQALEWAHAVDPQAKLFYNDYDAEAINRKSDAVYAMAKDFKRRAVPLEGVGFQFHVTLEFATPEKLRSVAENFKRFAALELELHITELDIRLSDRTPAWLEAQARLYQAIAKLCIEQPACKLIQTWGVTDQHTWIPHAYPGMGWPLLWDANYQAKPAYYGLLDGLREVR